MRSSSSTTPRQPIGLAVVIPAILALLAYEKLLPARTAEGSALTLRTESFRRFLAASEGPHVEWAWKHGLLREYSAWAVALGEASTWEKAMERSSIPPAEFATGPMIVYTSAGSFGRSPHRPELVGRLVGRRVLGRQCRWRRRRRQLGLVVSRTRS